MEIRSLTRAEEEIMQILWRLKRAFVKDILEVMPNPKPAYNTVSTIVRILEKKGFVGYTPHGKTHEYFPSVSFEEYQSFEMSQLVSNYFNNSLPQMVSFFVENKNVSVRELDEIMKIIEKHKAD